MDFYFVKLDVRNYIETNLKNIILGCVVIVVGMVLGFIIALTTNLEVVEEGGNAYFVFLTGGNVNLFIAIFFGSFLYFALLVLSRINQLVRRLGMLVILFRSCEFFSRLVLALRYFGIRCFIGVVLSLVIEVLVCLLLLFLYLLNNNDRYFECKRIFGKEYLLCVAIYAVFLLVFVFLLYISYNFLAIFA